MTQSMVERVAAALEEKISAKDFTSYEEAARAAMEAMRNPTDEMLQEMHEAVFFGGTQFPGLWAAFEAAIDAALIEKGGDK